MARIGEARCDENGKTSYGQPGDQTTREVCISDFYINSSKPWQKVFRAKSQDVRNRLAQNMELACNNENIGYAQYGDGSTKYRDRYGLYFALQTGKTMENVSIPCNCDCSTLVAECCILSGVSVSIYMSTSNECQILRNTGAFDELDFSAGMVLISGDIMWRQGHTGIITKGDEKDWDKNPKWVAEANAYCNVYNSNSTSSGLLKEWPHLGKGNLVDVCDEDANFYYVRIAGKYYGFVEKKYLSVPTPTPPAPFEKFDGEVTTQLNVRIGPAATYGYCVFDRNDGKGARHTLQKGEVVTVLDIQNGWYNLDLPCTIESQKAWVNGSYIKKIVIDKGTKIQLNNDVLYASKSNLNGTIDDITDDKYLITLSDGCKGYVNKVDVKILK